MGVAEYMASIGRHKHRSRFVWTGEAGVGVAFDSQSKLIAAVLGYSTTWAYTSKVDKVKDFVDLVEPWADGLLSPPAGVPQPFWYSYLDFYDTQVSLLDGAYHSVYIAVA